METKFQTSFIPKQPINEPARHSSGSSIIFLAAFIIFIASIAGSAGAFLYNQYVDKSIKDGTEQLNINENAFDPTTIQELTRLNDRLSSVDTLLKQHVAASNVFGVLSNATLKTVRFNDFSYSNSGDGKVLISMRGQATTYETVALQSKQFTDPSLKNVLKSSIFGDLNLDASGNVGFSFSAGLDPLLVSYYKTIKDRTSPLAPESASATDANSVVQTIPPPAQGGFGQPSPTSNTSQTQQ